LKESWRDEYLKWICGFANASGGHLSIGVNNEAQIVVAKEATQLLVEISNKVRDILGIMVAVFFYKKMIYPGFTLDQIHECLH
jgi:ATP-dependent DNA helicase RecG